MLYLLQDTDHSYALVSDSGQADGWYDNISHLDTNLNYKYIKSNYNTWLDAFANRHQTVVATFSNISEFYNLHQTHPELFL